MHPTLVTTHPIDAGPEVTRTDKAGVPFLIRPLRPGDRAALHAFYEEFEPKRAAQGLPPFGAERVARWLSGILPIGAHLVACRGGELIGHAFVVPTGEERVEEYAIFLRRDTRGRGVGTELNRAAVEAARARGVRRLWLSVEPHNRAAIRSYEKVGFRFLPATIFSPEAEMQLHLG